MSGPVVTPSALAEAAGQGYPQCWDEPWMPPASLKDPLRSVMITAHERTLVMSPDEKRAMFEAQRQSFIRAMAPCEHGDPDWETCPHCIAALRTTERGER